MDIYDTIKTIGSGSFGQVYLARHKREGKHYVIKRVKTRDMSQKDLENTENEVRLLQKIRHTNIVAYKDSYVDREQFLNIVMVYCDGGDIYTKIKATQNKGKNFPEVQIVDWLAQMSLALLYLHERKILHRDMKTQNIFLKNGKVSFIAHSDLDHHFFAIVRVDTTWRFWYCTCARQHEGFRKYLHRYALLHVPRALQGTGLQLQK